MPAISIASTAQDLNRYNVLYNTEIRQKMQVGMVTEGYLKPVPTEHTYVSPNVRMSDIVQAYQPKFTPKGTGSFDQVANTLQLMKIDIKFEPEDLDRYHDSWMVEWVEQGKSRLEWSFPRWIWENVIMPKFEDNMEIQVAYNGVYVAPVDGQAGVTMNSCDGIGTKLSKAILAGGVVPFQMGNITPSTSVSYMEDFCKRLPFAYRFSKLPIFCAPELAADFYFDRRERFGRNVDYTATDSQQVEAYNKIITPLPSMAGSKRMICTPNRNIIKGLKRGANPYPVVRWQEQDRMLKGLSEFYRFYGFEFYEEVFCNDVA
jgi:hypothetical protein